LEESQNRKRIKAKAIKSTEHTSKTTLEILVLSVGLHTKINIERNIILKSAITPVTKNKYILAAAKRKTITLFASHLYSNGKSLYIRFKYTQRILTENTLKVIIEMIFKNVNNPVQRLSSFLFSILFTNDIHKA
jgi:hypothetical protein